MKNEQKHQKIVRNFISDCRPFDVVYTQNVEVQCYTDTNGRRRRSVSRGVVDTMVLSNSKDILSQMLDLNDSRVNKNDFFKTKERFREEHWMRKEILKGQVSPYKYILSLISEQDYKYGPIKYDYTLLMSNNIIDFNIILEKTFESHFDFTENFMTRMLLNRKSDSYMRPLTVNGLWVDSEKLELPIRVFDSRDRLVNFVEIVKGGIVNGKKATDDIDDDYLNMFWYMCSDNIEK